MRLGGQIDKLNSRFSPEVLLPTLVVTPPQQGDSGLKHIHLPAH